MFKRLHPNDGRLNFRAGNLSNNSLRRYIYSLAVGTLVIAAVASGQVTNEVGRDGNIREIQGETTNELQPRLLISKQQNNWDFAIDFTGPTNVPRNDWLKVPNRVGSKIELWLNDGRKLEPTDADARGAMNLPAQTTVGEATSGINRRWRSGQWVRIPGHLGRNGQRLFAQTGSFELSKIFGASFTNDVKLKITPVLYKRESNDVVRLVEFPPITMDLMTNGDVQKVTSQ
jgi:hypothetical protein